MNKIKRRLCAALSLVMILAAVILPAGAEPVAAGSWLPDIAGHWAEEEIRAAASWVNGYPDNTFRPDANVTQAELVKLLLQAADLAPGFRRADWLHQVSDYGRTGEKLGGLDGHWLTVYGWTQVALDFGLIVPGDYPSGEFRPDRPATRLEAAVMIDRILGLVYPATQSMEEKLPFTDSEGIPEQLRGYVFQAVKAGVLTGYPDGSFQWDRTITRAEAVVMVSRALAYMEQGLDYDVRVYAEDVTSLEKCQQRVRMWLSAPALVIEDVIYLPARDLVTTNASLYGPGPLERTSWDPVNQRLALTYTYPFQCGAGDTRYAWSYGELNENSATFPASARMLYGELMIPMYEIGGEARFGYWGDAEWNAESKTLFISMGDHGPIGS